MAEQPEGAAEVVKRRRAVRPHRAVTKSQRHILFALGKYYQMLNQPLIEKPLRLSTSKITFIELLLKSGIAGKQERALYKNLETLEGKKLVEYERRMIKLTERGLQELERVQQEIRQFAQVENFFQQSARPRRKLQTMIRSTAIIFFCFFIILLFW